MRHKRFNPICLTSHRLLGQHDDDDDDDDDGDDDEDEGLWHKQLDHIGL